MQNKENNKTKTTNKIKKGGQKLTLFSFVSQKTKEIK
jgi:hypothetical protein